MRKTYIKAVSFLGSKLFFWVIVGLFALQALWVAFSFRFPLPYDEWFHFGLIKVYSHHLSPIIANQPPANDIYGDLFHQGSYLYHYLMSFPYRLIAAVTNSQSLQVVALRVINIALFASGLFLFSRMFRKIGIKQKFINVSLLFLVLLPMTSEVAATINYDNLLFPLSAIFFIYCARIIMAKRLDWLDYAGMIIVGCVASLVQFEFLPVFAVAVVYMVVLSWRRYGRNFLGKLTASAKRSSKITLATGTVLLVIFVSLFCQVYVADTVRYHTPDPGCSATLSKSRCMSNPVFSHYQAQAATKNQRTVTSLPNFSLMWLQDLETFATWSAAVNTNGIATTSGPLPLLYTVVFAASVGSIAVLLYAWRSMPKNETFYFLATVIVAIALAMFLTNVRGYYANHAPSAIQTRYLLPVLPVFIVFVILAANFALQGFRRLKIVLLSLTLMMLLVFGGGVSTHILLSQDNWYWQKGIVIRLNHDAKKIIKPITKQSIGNFGT